VRDVSSCVQAPVYLSFPHFYAADPNYLQLVNGLEPNRDVHSFHMTFQKVRYICVQNADSFVIRYFSLRLNCVLRRITDYS